MSGINHQTSDTSSAETESVLCPSVETCWKSVTYSHRRRGSLQRVVEYKGFLYVVLVSRIDNSCKLYQDLNHLHPHVFGRMV